MIKKDRAQFFWTLLVAIAISIIAIETVFNPGSSTAASLTTPGASNAATAALGGPDTNSVDRAPASGIAY